MGGQGVGPGMITPTQKIWKNGEWIAWDDARVHVMTHALHYGTSVFEGIRCYETKKGPRLFRLPEHIRRMYDSAKIYRMDLPTFSPEELQGSLRQSGARKRSPLLLRSPGRLPRLRRSRRAVA